MAEGGCKRRPSIREQVIRLAGKTENLNKMDISPQGL